MKKIAIILVSIFLFTLFPNISYGAKKTTTTKKSAAPFSVSPKLRKDRQALIVYFNNLKTTKSVSYMLTYKTNGQEEGAGGSVNPPQGNNASRELLFGTCSKNVCRYHPNLSSMNFEVKAQLKSGKNLLKRYKIKI